MMALHDIRSTRERQNTNSRDLPSCAAKAAGNFTPPSVPAAIYSNPGLDNPARRGTGPLYSGSPLQLTVSGTVAIAIVTSCGLFWSALFIWMAGMLS